MSDLFKVETTAYMRSADRNAEHWALIYGEPPVQNGNGTTTYKLRFPALVVPEYIDGAKTFAERAAAILNVHWAGPQALLADAVKPYADYQADLPDYDDPLRCVYESGIQYAVDLLAKVLKVESYEICDGTEEFDGDLGGTLLNIVLEAMPKDKHGDPIHPSELAQSTTLGQTL